MRRLIPNAITCGNLLCGCLGLVEAFGGRLRAAVILTGVAALLDFGDGLAARLLRVQSPMGKELDSLADVTTFGVLPAVLVFQLMAALEPVGLFEVAGLALGWPHVAFAIAVGSALRLAKFNIDERQTDQFIGVPTPANALLVASLVWLRDSPAYAWLLGSAPALAAFSVVSALLLVAPLPLFALKFKNLSLRDNWYRFLFLGLSVVLLLWLAVRAVPLIILIYLLLSAVVHEIHRRNRRDAPPGNSRPTG